MIGFIKGYLIDKQYPGKMVINVNGVGYEVEISLQTFAQLDNVDTEISLYIQTVVREDAFLLYGFIDKSERAVFRSLIKVNGIGPKVALSLLSATTPKEFIHMILLKNVRALTQLPGIGKKTAERLVIEMQDAFSNMALEGAPSDVMPTSTNNNQQSQAISALEGLGYTFQEASAMVKKLDDGNKSCEILIRESLKQFSLTVC